MIIVLLGPPGAGKGTQAERIRARYDVAHVSTGDMFRAALKDGSELGRAVKQYLDAGRLVPDDVTTEVLSKRMNAADCRKGVLLDGFPRTQGQADALDNLLRERDMHLDAVLYFDVSDETAVKRLSGRRLCKGCGAGYHVKYMPPRSEGVCDKCGGELYRRADDRPETIRERLRVYADETCALVEEYGRRGLLKRIDANGSPDPVASAVVSALDAVSHGR